MRIAEPMTEYHRHHRNPSGNYGIWDHLRDILEHADAATELVGAADSAALAGDRARRSPQLDSESDALHM